MIQHPLGPVLKTPAVVPSFSSKAFSPRTARRDLKDALQTASEVIPRITLLSAYDIAYGFLQAPSRLPLPELTILDSGGYEASNNHDHSDAYRHAYYGQKWTRAMYRQVLDAWPDSAPAVVVSFDQAKQRIKYEQQVERAVQLLDAYPRHLHTLLLKSEPNSPHFVQPTLEKLFARASDAAPFQIIGLTEKELGRTMFERMVALAKTRRALSAAGLDTAIQVFGALDPLSVYLYFVAGADIFDGLTWLRFAFSDGACTYKLPHGIKEHGIKVQDRFIDARVAIDNIVELQRMEDAMHEFVVTSDFDKFGTHGEFIKQACDALLAEVGS